MASLQMDDNQVLDNVVPGGSNRATMLALENQLKTRRRKTT